MGEAGSRQFHYDPHNWRQVAGCIGLAPTPYSSGDSQTEQGIAKAGNKRARWIMVELGWSWLRYQPESDLVRRREGHGNREGSQFQ